MNYQDFIKSKTSRRGSLGIQRFDIPASLYDFQAEIVSRALRAGKFAIFADCGLGKTIMQLAWAANIPGDVIIAAPLAVAEQTQREGERFGISVRVCESQSDIQPGISITNYEKLHKFDLSHFTGVVLDESSILKNYSGKIRSAIIDGFSKTPFKLACSATPAPNDFMELGNHAEFLNVCSRTEMLAEYFVHDGGETQKWRIKGHAVKPFWSWVGSWAISIRKPSDIGFDDGGFDLPEMNISQCVVRANYQQQGFLFPMIASTLGERQSARKLTVDSRAQTIAGMVNADPRQHIIWCNLNSEADAIRKLIPDAVEVRGSDTVEKKKSAMLGFTSGDVRVLVTKPSIAGFGMNWQHCSSVFFCGLSDSYEEFYQAVRRCWRYGQRSTVDVRVVISDTEGAVVANIKRKELESAAMAAEMANLYKLGASANV